MEKVPYSKYTKELRQEAVRLVTEGGLSVGEASMRLSLDWRITSKNCSLGRFFDDFWP